MPSFNYTRILTISTAALAGATCGAFVNQKSDNQTAKIIDYHVHMMSPQLFKITDAKWKQLEEPLSTEPNLNGYQLMQQMKRLNISKSLVVSSAYLYTSETMQSLGYDEKKETEMVQTENNYIYNQCHKYPSKLISSFSVHPLKPYSIEEIERCSHQNGNKICKLHFSNSNVNLWNDDHLHKVELLFETVSEHNGCILLHFDNCYMDHLELDDIQQYVSRFMNRCVMPYPNLKIIFAHLGGFGGFDERTAEIFESLLSVVTQNDLYERIFFDISSVFFEQRPMEIVPALEEKETLLNLLNMMDDKGMLKQLVFGSDYPFVEHSKYLKDLREHWPLSPQKLESILHNNIHF